MKGDVVSRRVRAFVLAAAVGLLVAGGTSPAGARPGQTPEVMLHTAAGLAPDGQSIGISVLAKCPERWTVVEAVVRVSQPQASGQGSFPLTCIGSFRSFAVNVPSSGGEFELGQAQATASVLIERGRTAQAQDSEVVTVEPTVFVDVADTALLQGAGEAVSIDVTSACPKGANGQQSYVAVSQGQSTRGTGFYTPMCDGQQHTVNVTVQASQGQYQVGTAHSFTFAFVEHGGNSFSGIDENTQMQILAP